MATPLAKFLVNRFKYLNLMESIGGCSPGQAKHDQLLLDACQQIIASIKTTRAISVEDAVEIQQLVAESPLTQDQKSNLVQVLDAKVNGGQDTSAINAKQNLLYFDNYLTDALVKLFASDAHTTAKLQATVKHLMALRASKLNEKSWSHILSIVLHTEEMDGNSKLLKLRELKSLMDKMKFQCSPVELYEFPKDVKHFITTCPDAALEAFGDSPPVKSPWNDVARQLLLTATPCRSSSVLVSDVNARRSAAGGIPRACVPAFNMLRDHMLHASQQGSMARSNSIDLPGFTWTAQLPKQPATMQQSMPLAICNDDKGVGQQLALPPAGQQLALPPAGQQVVPPQPPHLQDGAASLPAAGMPSQHIPNTNQKVGSDIHAITARIQAKVSGKKFHEAPIEDGEGSDEEDTQPPPKKKYKTTKATTTPANVRPKPAAATSQGGSKVKAWLTKVQKALPFPGKKSGPFFYEHITIYTNRKGKSWRVKPGVGRRDEKHVNFKNEPRVAWANVQQHAATYLAEGQ